MPKSLTVHVIRLSREFLRKRITVILAMLLFLLTGCGQMGSVPNNEIRVYLGMSPDRVTGASWPKNNKGQIHQIMGLKGNWRISVYDDKTKLFALKVRSVFMQLKKNRIWVVSFVPHELTLPERDVEAKTIEVAKKLGLQQHNSITRGLAEWKQKVKSNSFDPIVNSYAFGLTTTNKVDYRFQLTLHPCKKDQWSIIVDITDLKIE